MSTPAADTAATSTPTPDFGAMDSLSDYASARESVLHGTGDTPAGDAPVEAPAQADPTTEPDSEAQAQGDQADEQGRDEQGRYKPKRSAQRRIDEAIYQREEARREAASLREQLAALQRPHAQAAADPQGHTGAPAAQADPQPDPADLTRYPDGVWDSRFQADMARWGARQEVRAFQQQQLQQQLRHATEQQHESLAREFATRMEQAAQAEPALLAQLSDEVQALRPSLSLGQFEQPTGETAMADALLTSEQPARLAQYLSEHPDDFRRLAALHPTLAMREIGKIEARLDLRLDTAPRAGSVPQAPPTSQAKPPIQPVGRSVSSAASTRSPEQISSVAEWLVVRDRYASRT
jgi:hypothetical protein